uniref:CaMBD domain-containing protein n=1 Tax=Macrostomum lignano TaxID=282301 RepID=A0A1I8ITN7_9PLAT
NSTQKEADGDAVFTAPCRQFKYTEGQIQMETAAELSCPRPLIADLSLFFAMLGIVMMIIETELCIAGIFNKAGAGSIVMKSLISVSTAILLGFISWYHYLDIKVFMIDNSMDDWRLAITLSRGFHLAMELLVCAIHPIPGQHMVQMLAYDNTNSVRLMQAIPIDVIFSLPMFLRFYLVCRVMMLHSRRLYQDASSQSLGALNRIHFNFRFIFKSLMNLYPEYVLTVMALFLFIWASWAVRACEMYHGPEHRNFLNSMWMTAITFLTVGYGDIVPASYCGRGIAVLTGLFGTGVTALVVAVLARKLELSRAEKYVHNFVIDIELDKQVKHAAANILKEGWLSYKYKRAGNATKTLKHQRRLLHSIHRIRELRNDQKRLADSSVSLTEMYRNQGFMLTGLASVQAKAKETDAHLQRIEEKLDRLLQARGL